MGCSPYFAVTGAHPILPFDIAEATYLQPPPTSIMSTTDLISRHTDNLYTTQTPECTKEKYNVKMKMKGSLLRSHQQPM
jgi:hypothetical protein